MTSKMRILVSGAGIAGNAVAYLLARSGASVVVLERSEAMLAQGQNVDLNGAALTAVKRMNLLAEVKKNNTTEKGTMFVAPNGKQFGFFPQEKGSTSFTNEYEILRGDLAQLLYEKAKPEPNIEYRFGVSVEKVLENSEKSVKVQLSNGKTESFDLVVGADGQWSKVRRLVFPDSDITIIDKGAYCLYFTGEKQAQDTDWWQIYHALRSRVISIRPDPHGTIRWCCTCMPLDDKQKARWDAAMRADRKTQQDLIREEFRGAGWQAERMLDAMDKSPDFYCHSLKQIKMKSWSKNRVVCVGDAAWAPTPLTGQGTTLAMIGAYLLAAEIDRAGTTGSNMIEALQAYDRVFRGHVEKMQDIPSFVPGVAHPASAFKRWLLQTAIWTASYVLAFPPIKARLGTTEAEANDDGFALPPYDSLDAKLN